MAEPEPGVVSPALISAGQVIVGCTAGRVSTTVTVKLQLVPPLEQTTVVAPTGKDAPDGGLQVTGGVWPVSGSVQFPEMVAAG
jgi:hypothetical protein